MDAVVEAEAPSHVAVYARLLWPVAAAPGRDDAPEHGAGPQRDDEQQTQDLQPEQPPVEFVEPLNETTSRVAGSTDPIELDGIFIAEHDTDEDVYERTCRHMPRLLGNGYHCTVLAYGAAGSGASGALLGELEGDRDADTDKGGGIAPRLLRHLFDELRARPRLTECAIQCSIAELYREGVRDLLGRAPDADAAAPTDPAPMAPRVHRGGLTGCAAVSCLSADDVLELLRRARLVRTTAAAEDDLGDHHSPRSTLVLQLTLQMAVNHATEGPQHRWSRLLLVDCAAGPAPPTTGEGEAGGSSSESTAELGPAQALHAYVCEHIDTQKLMVQQSPPRLLNGPLLSNDNLRRLPVLVQLLTHSLGADCVTTVLVGANPRQASSVRALRFGADCRGLVNQARPQVHHAWRGCAEAQRAAADRADRMEAALHALAQECVRLRSRGGSFLVDRQLWGMIEGITAAGQEERPLNFVTENRTEHEHRLEMMRLRSDLHRVEDERDKAIAKAFKVKTDLISMKEQAKALNNHYRSQKIELETLRLENIALQQRKLEVEHNLRTSLFRESEAVVFLRQFRKFYSRLLHKMAKEGSGSVYANLMNTPGAPSLEQMVDIDRMMVESGLLEEDEIGSDSVVRHYRPSRQALSRSTGAVAEAELRLHDISGGQHHENGISDVKLSVVTRPETGETTEARQRLFETPSGRFVAMREKELESELLELSEKYISLHEQLEEEKAKVAMLAPAGGANERLETAQQLNALQSKLDQKEKDWQALILKMNELHLSAKDARDKTDNRNQHIEYLEATLADCRKQATQLIKDFQSSEKHHQIKYEQLRTRMDELVSPLWQFEESDQTQPPLLSRLVVSFSGAVNQTHFALEKRLSCNEPEQWIDTYFKPRLEASSALAKFAAQEYPVRPQVMMASSGSIKEMESLLFMSDDEVLAESPGANGAHPTRRELRSASNYGNLVDAYNSSSTAKTGSMEMTDGSHPDLQSLQLSSSDPRLDSEATFEDKVKPSKNPIIERLKAKAEAVAREERNEDSDPEWKRKFKKIGTKNVNEEVLETSGGAGAREFGRTRWEALKHSDRKTTPAAEIFASNKVNWRRPEKHGSDNDSDDGRGHSPYIGGTPIILDSDSESDDKDEEDTGNRGRPHDQDHSNFNSTHSVDSKLEQAVRQSKLISSKNDGTESGSRDQAPPCQSRSQPSDSDSDSDSYEESKPANRVAQKDRGFNRDTTPKPAPTQAPLTSGDHHGSSSDSDSDANPRHEEVPSSDDSRRNPQPIQPAIKPTFKLKYLESDSEASDNDSSMPQRRESPPPTESNRKTESDSDSETDSSPEAKRKSAVPPSAPTMAKRFVDDSQTSTPLAAVAPLTVDRDGPASDSASDSDSSRRSPGWHDSPRRSSERPPPPAEIGSDSDGSRSSSESEPSRPAPAVPVVAPSTGRGGDSDSDSASSSDNENDGFGGWSKPAPQRTQSGGSAGGVGRPTVTLGDGSSEDLRAPEPGPTRTSSSTLSRSVLTRRLSSESDGKDKGKFVIKDGRLIKMDSTSDLAEGKEKKTKTSKKGNEKKSPAAAKPSFMIIDGKLVKTEAGALDDKKSGKKKTKDNKKKKKKQK